jgi:hypothetical protein
VAGKAFWLKDPLRAFLVSAGVSAATYDRYSDEAKFKIARHVLSELDTMEGGYAIQRRILTDLCNLRNIPDPNVPDKDEALGALRYLKELALTQKLVAEEERSSGEQKLQEARRRQAALAARSQKMEELRKTFAAMATSATDPQSRGYGLEDLLADLFDIHEIVYRRPYVAPSEQIDGSFDFQGFDYLVEARWRKSAPIPADIVAFKGKVDRKLQSTRGLFVTMIKPSPEVLLEVTRSASSNIIVMDGEDLSLILEGRVSLVDAMELKIRKAAQEGITYFPLSGRF